MPKRSCLGRFSSWSTLLGREDYSVDSVIENLQEKALSVQVVHSNSEIIQQVMNLLKHELGVPSDISRMQKPPVLDACKKPTCLSAFPAQPRVHCSETNGGSILHHPGCIIYMCVCVVYAHVCMCVGMHKCVCEWMCAWAKMYLCLHMYVWCIYICKCAHVNECVYMCECVCVCVPLPTPKKRLWKTAWGHVFSHHISGCIASLLWENISQ